VIRTSGIASNCRQAGAAREPTAAPRDESVRRAALAPRSTAVAPRGRASRERAGGQRGDSVGRSRALAGQLGSFGVRRIVITWFGRTGHLARADRGERVTDRVTRGGRPGLGGWGRDEDGRAA
jgi:hypothetical protein